VVVPSLFTHSLVRGLGVACRRAHGDKHLVVVGAKKLAVSDF
jgi:hypothetical protein